MKHVNVDLGTQILYGCGFSMTRKRLCSIIPTGNP